MDAAEEDIRHFCKSKPRKFDSLVLNRSAKSLRVANTFQISVVPINSAVLSSDILSIVPITASRGARARRLFHCLVLLATRLAGVVAAERRHYSSIFRAITDAGKSCISECRF